MSYYYRVFGLNVQSQILCHELIELDERERAFIDVNVELGQVNMEIQEQIESGRSSHFDSLNMWFHIPKVATYWVTDGNRIVIEVDPEAHLDEIKQFLLGSCLGMIMLQQDTIAIHGGSVVINNQGLLITGDRGAGKSTLTSALRLKGYQLVADDVSALDVSELLIQPAYPQQKVCEDMMDQLGYDKSKYKSIDIDQKVKYLIPTKNQFKSEPVRLQGIIELVCSDEVDDIKVEELKGSQKLMTLYRNIYRIEMKIISGVNPNFFKQCVELSKGIPVYRITRPREGWSVDDQIEWIESRFLNEA